MSAPVTVDATRRRGRSVPAAVVALVRWPNALIASAGVVVGAAWARPDLQPTRELSLGVVAAWLVTAAVNALNDAFDVDIDRTAHPDRPLPRGELSVQAALGIGMGACVLGGGVGYALPAEPRLIVYGALAAALAYAVALNASLVLGNVIVAVVASLPFLLGGALVGDAGGALSLFVVAVPLHFAREVVKDVEDAPGDRGRRDTIPLRWGAGAARGVALAAVATYAVLATFLFAAAGVRLLGLLPSVLVAAWAVIVAPSRAPMLLKLAMLLAMAALPFLR